MSWSFTIKLMPGEEIIEQAEPLTSFGLKAEHSPILTNQRVMFKFNTLSSGLVQSFVYNEVKDARPAVRLMIDYLKLSAGLRDHYLKVDDPEYWAKKIIEFRDRFRVQDAADAGGSAYSRTELVMMLEKLHGAGVLNDEEFDQKRREVMG